MTSNYETQAPIVGLQHMIDQLLVNSRALGYGVAIWQMPGQSRLFIIVDTSEIALSTPIEIEDMPQGFAIHPFDGEGNRPTYLRADLLVEINLQNSSDVYGNQAVEVSGKKSYLWEELTGGKEVNNHQSTFEISKKIGYQLDVQRNYQEMVTLAVEKIKQGYFQKVVLSRRKQMPLPKRFSFGDHFLWLCQKYPSAFVSLVSTDSYGTWMGASPETLVSIDEERYFHTVALAGTQPKSNFSSLSEASWKEKEIEEQALVSRYIINCFKQIRLREFEEIGPRTVAAGHLLHLKTDFFVDMVSTNFPQLGSVMLQLLHPTSAVCGMPRDKSLHFILKNEGYERGLFSGYLGPVKVAGNTSLFVNLRCMQVVGQEAWLYAGAGITADSNPEKEYQETVMKMGTIWADGQVC